MPPTPYRLTLVLLLVAAGGWYWQTLQSGVDRVDRSNAETVPDSAAADYAVAREIPDADFRAAGTQHPNPDHPYQDTDVDGDVAVDSDGHFQPDQKALRLFDYFFIESGRLGDEEILQQIHNWLASRLGQPALSEALDFLDQYMALRQLAAEAYAAGEIPDDPASRLELIRSLQEQAFGPELAQQLYGEEYRRKRIQITRMEALARGETVDPTAGMSDAETRVYQRIQSVEQAAQMAAQTSDPERLWGKRSEAYGYEAAYRLGELDLRRKVWDSRLTAYRLEKQALLADSELTDAERDKRHQLLLEQHFDAIEQVRVQALERIATAAADSDRAAGPR